uniref:Capsid n=1 Tax=viral metagenome TaxID=1070528 RepID=A0A2V0RLM9_9ZZZZ
MTKNVSGAKIGQIILDELLCKEGSLCEQLTSTKKENKMASKPLPKPRNQKTTAKSSKSAVSGKSKGNTPRKRQTRRFSEPDTSISQDVQVNTLGEVSSRVTVPYSRGTTAAFPQSVDMFHYGMALYPAGDSVGGDSLARDHYQSVIGPKLLAAIRNALTYGPAAAISIDETADYINEVSNAYFHLIAIRNLYRYLFYRRNSTELSAYFDLIYDETIPPAHTRLANALGQMYLPQHVKSYIERLAGIYYLDETPFSSVFQIVPYVGGFNNAASFVAGYTAQISAVENVTKRADMNSAFNSPRFFSDFVSMVPLDIETHRNPDLFLKESFVAVYNEEMLDIWANLPLEATDVAAGVDVNHPVAAVTTTIYDASFGDNFTKLTQANSAKYLTANTRYEPGILIPADPCTGANESNMRAVSSVGDVDFDVANQLILYYGILARNVENTSADVITAKIMPAGSKVTLTTMEHKASDTYDVMDALFSA